MENAVVEWAADNPAVATSLSMSYSSSANPFLYGAEAAYFETIRGHRMDAGVRPTPLQAAARQWLDAHPHEPDAYSSTGNRFLWAAEAAYFERFPVIEPPARSTHPGTTKLRIPGGLRWKVWERDDFTCRHCGIRRFLSVDHILPESKGGTLALDNLQTLCRSCNSRKGTQTG